MRRTTIFFCGLILVTGIFFASAIEKEQGIEGIWLGTLKTPGADVRLVFSISSDPEGGYKAAMDSPDQGAKDITMDSVVFKDGLVTIEFKAAMIHYEGTLSPDGKELTGTFKQGGFTAPFNLKRVKEAPKVIRTQDPKKPYPYLEEEVSYKNTEADITLAGTLTIPKEGGPFPAVILITGSGAQNRDEEIMGHRPFLVLADHLTRKGIAVLRVDDRGIGGSTGDIGESTSKDFAGDVLAGVDFLKGRDDINHEKIGLCGHSEGGIIAPIAAVRSDDVAFIVLMAGTGMTGEEILYLQGALIARASGFSEEDIQKSTKNQKRIFAVVKKHKDVEAIKEELQALFEKDMKEMSEEDKKKLGSDPKAEFEMGVKQILSKWFRFFLTYDPLPTLRKVKCPVLAINGEKDLQVPPKENLTAIEKALKETGNTDYTIKELPGLNHLFQKADTGATTEYAKITETINPAALKIISSWILEQVKQ